MRCIVCNRCKKKIDNHSNWRILRIHNPAREELLSAHCSAQKACTTSTKVDVAESRQCADYWEADLCLECAAALKDELYIDQNAGVTFG